MVTQAEDTSKTSPKGDIEQNDILPSSAYRTLFESVPGLYLVLKPGLDWIIVAASEAYLQATMTRREDIIGRKLFDVFPNNPDDPTATGVEHLRASLQRVIKNRVADKMAVQRYDIRHSEIEDGGFEVGYWSVLNSPVLDEKGNVAYIIHSVTDVTERKHAEEDLANQQKWLESILHLLPIPLLFIEPGTARVTFANKAADYLAGGSFPKGKPGEEYDTIYYCYDAQGRRIPNDQMPGVRAAHGEKLENFQMDWDTPLGRLSVLLNSDTLLPAYGYPETVVVMFQDITKIKELERLKDEFISMASHELKTPITSIKGFTQVLQSRFRKREDEETLRFLAKMDGQLNKLTQLISDLLDVSKMETNKLPFREEQFDLVGLVRETVENIQATASTHELRIEGVAEVQVFGDRDRLEQVLINLINNAIKYSWQADKVIIHIAADAENVTVSIQDFGIGIAEAHQERIFERFYQVSDSTEKPFSGLGIGLYISNEIIRRHDGYMRVKSRRGEGSIFSFTLPQGMRKEATAE